MTESEMLQDIQKAFDIGVLNEISDAFVASHMVPSDKLCEALGAIIGKSTSEVRALMKRRDR